MKKDQSSQESVVSNTHVDRQQEAWDTPVLRKISTSMTESGSDNNKTEGGFDYVPS